jgi:hypothetical protein
VDVLVEFADGSGVVLPALDGYLAGLTFEEGELVDVSYEPSDTSPLWPEYQLRSGELRTLRALVAASAQLGVFRLDGEGTAALDLAARMQLSKGLDPALAVYAGYAYDAIRERERIRQMLRVLGREAGFRPFDLALLSGDLDGRTLGRGSDVAPFAPLLSQGWALLSAHEVTLPPSIRDLTTHLLPSLWSLYDRGGVELIRAAMTAEENP